MNYATYKTTLASMVPISESDTNFTTILPQVIEYAEQRIYRELDLLAATVRDTSSTFTANSRNFTLPSSGGRFVTVDGVNVIVSGTRTYQLIHASRDLIDAMWPSESAASASTVPQFYGMITDQSIIVGPPPGSNYTAEVIGKIRPTALSADNTTTFLSNYLPDLFLAASMVFYTGYMKNFGAQADDPKMAQSWEAQYEKLLASANAEELRKKFGMSPRG